MTNTFQKILMWLFVVVAIGSLGLYVFFRVNGKAIAEQSLSEAFGNKTSIEDVRFIFPLGLRLDSVKVENVFSAREIRIQLGFPVVWGNRYVFSKVSLLGPAIVLVRNQGSKIVLGGEAKGEEPPASVSPSGKSGKKESPAAVEPPSPEKKKRSGFVIDHLEIMDGQAKFTDYSSDKEKLLDLKEIQMNARRVVYPLIAIKTKFYLTASIFNVDSPFSGSRMESQGWIDFYSKDMDGNFKIMDPGGTIGLTADLKAQKNDLTVRGKVNVENLAGVTPQKDESEVFSFDELLVGALASTGIKINVDFAIKTELDNFRLNSISFSGAVEYDESKKTAESIKETFKNLGQQFLEKSEKKVGNEEKVSP